MAIDEKKLIEELEEQYKNFIPEDDWDYCKIRQIKADIKVVNRQPTVQPQGIDKDRLTTVEQDWLPDSERFTDSGGFCIGEPCDWDCYNCDHFEKMLHKLSRFENLFAQNRLICLPQPYKESE